MSAAVNERRRQRYRENGYYRNIKDKQLQARYGISCDEYNEMSHAQGGVCAICGNPPGQRDLAVDHDHETGRVRGLLCITCNRGIGNFRDDPALLRAAVDYLDVDGSTYIPRAGFEDIEPVVFPA